MSGETVKPWLNICKYGGSVAEWLVSMLNSATLYTSKWHRAIHLHRNMLSRGPSTPLRLQTLAGESNHHPDTVAICPPFLSPLCVLSPDAGCTSAYAVPLHRNVASRGPSTPRRGLVRSLCLATWHRAIHLHRNVASRGPSTPQCGFARSTYTPLLSLSRCVSSVRRSKRTDILAVFV